MLASFKECSFEFSRINFKSTSEKNLWNVKTWKIGAFLSDHLPTLAPRGYKFIHDLGKGAFGMASLLESEKDNKFKVMKVIVKANLKDEMEREEADKEI